MPYNEENRSGRWYIPAGNLENRETDGWYETVAAQTPDETPPAQTPSFSPYSSTPSGPSVPPDEQQRRAKKRRNTIRTVAIVLCCALVLGALVFVIARYGNIHIYVGSPSAAEVLPGALPDAGAGDEDVYEYFNNYFTGTSDIRIPAAETGTGVTLELSSARGPELSLQEIYQTVSPSVVGVTTYVDGAQYSWGTGVVFTADGYLITNTHVIEGSDAAVIRFTDGTEYEAALVGSDSATDIAVLKIDAQGLPYAAFADSADCLVGDGVVAIGNPLGDAYAGTMTNGIISAIDRSVSNNGHSMTLLQTNAALNEGNSGGPLINLHGQVIGITNMKIMYSYYAAVEGIGFAIPTSVIKPVVDSIIENGLVLGNPTIGIVAGSVSAEAKERYGLPDGIYVSEVNENSDAYRQGLRVGDVITAVNGTPVASVAEVNAIKDGFEVGDLLTAAVYREGDSFLLEFALVDQSVIQ